MVELHLEHQLNHTRVLTQRSSSSSGKVSLRNSGGSTGPKKNCPILVSRHSAIKSSIGSIRFTCVNGVRPNDLREGLQIPEAYDVGASPCLGLGEAGERWAGDVETMGSMEEPLEEPSPLMVCEC